MKDYDLEIKQYEERIRQLQEEKKLELEKEEIRKRREEEVNKLKDEMIDAGKKLVNLRNEYVVACSDFRKAFSNIDGFSKWEGLLIDKDIANNKVEYNCRQVYPDNYINDIIGRLLSR